MVLKIDTLIKKINEINQYSTFIDDEDLENSIIRILLSLINNQDIFFGLKPKSENLINHHRIANQKDLVSLINKSNSVLVFQTSGTTGTPKTVKKTIDKIRRGIIVKEELLNSVWGFCYSTRHISGLYVILQTILTNSTFVDLRNKTGITLTETLIQHKVSHLSAPSTFFKLNFPLTKMVESIKVVTNGGEPLTADVYNNILKSCPNCIVRNVYASTEFGSLLVSNSKFFTIPQKLIEKVKIIDDKIWVHRSLLSEFNSSNVEWFDTKDKVRILGDGSFEILGRMSEDVKVLGHLVSIRKVEEIISKTQQVKNCRIKIRTHKVFGAILICEVVPRDVNESFNMKQFKDYLKDSLRNYEIPQKIEVVKEIETTFSGKIKR